jgi:subfamily B ATP-binding cassette protein MsbA
MREFARRLWQLVRPYRFRLFLGIVMGVLCGLVEPLLMITVKFVVNAMFPTAGQEAMVSLPAWAPPWLQNGATRLNEGLAAGVGQNRFAMGFVVACIPLVMLLRAVTGFLNIYFLQWVAIRTITDLRTRLFNHLLRLPLTFFHSTSTGELISRIASDTGALQSVVSNSLSVLVKDPVTLIGLLVFLFWSHPSWTLMSLLIFPICTIPIVTYSRRARRSAREIQNKFGELSSIIHEGFTGNRIIKAYNLEDRMVDQFNSTARKFIGHYMRLVRAIEIPGPLIECLGSIGIALFFFYVALSSGVKTTPGDFLQFVGAIFLLYRPIKSLTRLHSQFEQARAASEHVFELLGTQSSLVEPARPQPLRAANADIQFQNIDFSYGDKLVLKDINLTVKAGQLVALVGSSGSGKTTLTNLLLRFYDPSQGSIRIGGTDIREVSLRDLHDQIAVVTQETILFNETVRQNIGFGRMGATPAEIEAAAVHAHAHEFIMAKPQGYDTVVGEKGTLLSGGQRQRLAIARAILKDAPILVLDEATSSLDSESERAVQAALDELMEGRTTICIAHRLSTISKADLIVVMDAGRIIEMGTHSELVRRDGLYRRLHDLQFSPGDSSVLEVAQAG